jgi:DNA-binding transcriptional MerR regulator
MRYSIKDLEKLSGIKAHTIRVWEKRYQLFSPIRSDTNIRSYSGNDLKKLLNVAQLNREGIKISKIVDMTPVVMDQEVLKLFKESKEVELAIDRLIAAMIDLNELEVEHILADLLIKEPFDNVVMHYIFPFLERIGVLWQTGSISPAQEHFISNVIRNRIIVATDKLPVPGIYKPARFILFLRESELHELGLLFCNYMLKKARHKTIYLGQSVPLSDLVAVQDEYQANYIVTSLINSNLSPNIDAYLKMVDVQTPRCTLISFGEQMKQAKYQSPSFYGFTATDKLVGFIESF